MHKTQKKMNKRRISEKVHKYKEEKNSKMNPAQKNEIRGLHIIHLGCIIMQSR